MEPADVTDLLHAWKRGESQAEEALLERVYGVLSHIANAALRGERSDHTLEPRALVHEVYLRLLPQQGVDWQSRSHFFAVAGRMMRRVLLDHAKQRGRGKRGAGRVRVVFDDALSTAAEREPSIIAVDDALASLARLDPEAASIVELRFFGGLTVAEAAQVLGTSPRSLARRWTLARAWLLRELTTRDGDGC